MDMSPFYKSIEAHNIKELTQLCSKNKKFDVPNDQYYYPLHFSIEKGFLDLVKLLVEHGSNVNFNYKESPLIASIRLKQIEIMNYLLENGADVSLIDEIFLYFI